MTTGNGQARRGLRHAALLSLGFRHLLQKRDARAQGHEGVESPGCVFRWLSALRPSLI